MAAADEYEIVVIGKPTHGGHPHRGIDPIVVSSVISIGQINDCKVWNIIPEKVEMIGAVRFLDKEVSRQIQERLKKTAQSIAEATGVKAEVVIEKYGPICCNDLNLHRKMLPTLQRLVSEVEFFESPASMGGEGFAYYQEKIPGFFFFIGVSPTRQEPVQLHHPSFNNADKILILEVRAMSNPAIDDLNMQR